MLWPPPGVAPAVAMCAAREEKWRSADSALEFVVVADEEDTDGGGMPAPSALRAAELGAVDRPLVVPTVAVDVCVCPIPNEFATPIPPPPPLNDPRITLLLSGVGIAPPMMGAVGGGPPVTAGC